MACEARIMRVLRILEYPGLDDVLEQEGSASSPAKPSSFVDKPGQLARMVAWIEDRKVRARAIADREPLRTTGPHWETEFFSYLQENDCPYVLEPTAPGSSGKGEPNHSLLLGLSWLVNKAVACEFEDRGKEYNAAARELLAAPQTTASPAGPTAGTTQASPQSAKASNLATDADGDTATAPWSLAFLSALDEACRALGVESPSLPPPPAAAGANQTASQVAGDGGNARVLRDLEALLAEAKRRRARRDMDMDAEYRPGTGTEGVEHGVEAFASGVSTGDESCDRVATVLRMLFLLDLRDVQDEVNGILGMAQASKA